MKNIMFLVVELFSHTCRNGKAEFIRDLLLVSLLLSVFTMLLIDGCAPPAQPWRVFRLKIETLWDWNALGMVLAYTSLQGALYYLPFGQVAEGKIGHNGKRLQYNMNGLYAFAVTLLLLGGLWYRGVFQGSMVGDRTLQLVCASTVVALLLSSGLHLHSLWLPPGQLVNYGKKSNFLQEFALGRVADPRVGRIDMKQFVMVRIGFMGWAVVDLSFLLTEIEKHGAPSIPLLLVVTFHLLYILELLTDEASVLPTKEYTQDGLGFLMMLGEFMWIPYFSSLPVYYLLKRHPPLSVHWAFSLCVLYGLGFLFYHLSNVQKDGFRKNPEDPAYAHLVTIPTNTGKSLLVSGWFGWIRHPNYLGDIMMTLAWCLPCGFCSLLPYLPVMHCANLLRRRAAEIESECHAKYGPAWEEYCRRVPYRLFPYVY
ncbi:delta(14)-sterol reductase TM7SF2 isoform X2 [Amia ocellicauda]|uniref:delta(14)-sterol reductase TM7SF2 isoform X2 n=1 Tax=Amia ocellicauda TaxID=2972642 RepID=UPI00346395B4